MHPNRRSGKTRAELERENKRLRQHVEQLTETIVEANEQLLMLGTQLGEPEEEFFPYRTTFRETRA